MKKFITIDRLSIITIVIKIEKKIFYLYLKCKKKSNRNK